MNREKINFLIAREYGVPELVDVWAFIARSVQKVEDAMDSARAQTKEICSTSEDLMLGFDTDADRDLFIDDVLTTGCGCTITRYEDGKLKQARLAPQDFMTK